jgi:hypothetical protein
MQTLNNIKVTFKDPEVQPSQTRSAFEQKIKSVRNPSGPFSLNKAYEVIALTDPASSGVQRALVVTDYDEFAWVELEWLLHYNPVNNAYVKSLGYVEHLAPGSFIKKVEEEKTEPSISEETNDSVEVKRGRKPKAD